MTFFVSATAMCKKISNEMQIFGAYLNVYSIIIYLTEVPSCSYGYRLLNLYSKAIRSEKHSFFIHSPIFLTFVFSQFGKII